MEMKSIIEKLEKSSFKIVGNLDRREKEELEELELQKIVTIYS